MNTTLKQILIAGGAIIFGALVAGIVSMMTRLRALEAQLAAVGAQIAPVSAVYQAAIIKTLTHSETPIVDKLLVKVGRRGVLATITPAEKEELLVALETRADDPEVGEYETCAAKALPYVMRMNEIDKERMKSGAGHLVDVQVVGRVDIGEEEGGQ